MANTETTRQPAITTRKISLPKGGGAVRGITTGFQPDVFTGAATFSIPFDTTVARGLEPALSVNYNSGSGNGIFGLGFSLSLSTIAINTDKGIPLYSGNDLYSFSEAGELTKSELQPLIRQQYEVIKYLPRVESAFSLIEQWIDTGSGESFWKVTSAANIVSYYGRSQQSRISNPANPLQVFEWLIDETIDAKGNRVLYSYKAENNEGVPVTIENVNRNFTANRYISNIQYGNFIDENKKEQFAFEVIFDYGEYDLTDPSHAHTPVRPWPCRPDPFSRYNSGFEIRTCRRCHHILLFHHFKRELGDPCLVQSLGFNYTSNQSYSGVMVQGMSLLTQVISKGYRKQDDGSFIDQQIPALDFNYSAFEAPVYPGYKQLQMGNTTIPGYLDEADFQPVDLYGEGLPGFLYSNDTTTLYLRPEGNGQYTMPNAQAQFPIDRNLNDGTASLVDLDGNSELELVVNNEGRSGFYQSRMDGSWENYRPFNSYPNNITNPQIEYADLNGNGKMDAMIAGNPSLLVYTSNGKEGYSAGKKVLNLTGFPTIQESNKHEYVGFADMFGDSLPHRLRVRNGCVECWPCLGHGTFGEKITFGRSPVFGKEFNRERLFLADIDGSGFTDLIYISNGWLQIYFNQSGNSFTEAVQIKLPDTYTALDRISFIDVTGDGTTCLVFTKMDTVSVHYYYNFNARPENAGTLTSETVKPYLLVEIDNNMGTLSQVKYSSSVRFYVEDRRAGRPWKTKLPFPVQLVETMTVLDRFTGTVFTNKFNYHDGYYDPYERAFCGFGFVESWDTSSYEEFILSPQNPDFPVNRLNRELFVPPVYTKTWYHNGSQPAKDADSRRYAHAFFRGEISVYEIADSYIDPAIYAAGVNCVRQAYYSLKGQQIRTEVYADDKSNLSANPYTVDESNIQVLLLQPPLTNDGHAVLLVTPREAISYNYERDLTDPVIQQSFYLETDLQCGKPLMTASVYLPRRTLRAVSTTIYPEQLEWKITLQLNRYINVNNSGNYWNGISCEEKEFQLFNLDLNNKDYFGFDELLAQVQTALKDIVPYDGVLTAGAKQARQFSWLRRYFWDPTGSDCAGYLALGSINPQGLLHHEELACFTKEIITGSFPAILTNDIIEKDAGYYYDTATGYWWNQGLVQYYYDASQPEKYFQPYKTENCFSSLAYSPFSKSEIEYDEPYYFLPVKNYSYIDATTKQVALYTIDYQAFDYKQMVDANLNVSQVLFDPLGMVIVATLFGKEKNIATGGMRIYTYNGLPAEYNWTPATFDDILNDPKKFLQGATSYFYYNLQAWSQGVVTGKVQPTSSISILREDYYVNGQDSGGNGFRFAVSYYNGLGLELESKQFATTLKAGEKSLLEVQGRWLTSSRVVYNNKGKPCEQYFPVYDDTPYYESQDEFVNRPDVQAPTLTHYDPLLRVIRVDTPKGFYTKTVYGGWQQAYYDEDDTVVNSDYYIRFMASYPIPPIVPTQEQKDEMNALKKAAVFDNTPLITVLDNMGYTIRTIQTVPGRSLPAKQVNDIQGRVIELIDARLNEANEKNGTSHFNFRFRYMMDASNPYCIIGADTGTQLHFYNKFNSQLWSYSARDYCQFIQYDGLQRKLGLWVKKIDPLQPVEPWKEYNLAEKITWGEFAPDPTASNLMGEMYQLNDLSGITINQQYSMTGLVLSCTRQLVKEYKKAVDWSIEPVQMDGTPLAFYYTYNACDELLFESKPDQAIIQYRCNPLGLRNQIWVEFSKTEKQSIIDAIEYTPARQRQSVVYGNGVTSSFTYEHSTQRLIGLFSKRRGSNKTKGDPATTLQDITYTFDPVGNVTCMWDYSFETVFNNNQQVDPQAEYTYDALYRLLNANGRQHPGINGGTYRNNINDRSFKQSRFSQLPDVNDEDKLENYQESYTYDDSGNLLSKQHTAPSVSFTTTTTPFEISNQLQKVSITGIPDSAPGYDASGNPATVFINDAVPLVFNCCNNLVKAGIILRPDQPDDAEYYLYDMTETRMRKVREQVVQGQNTEITGMMYFDNYLVKRVSSASGTILTGQLERNTLRVMDGNSCVAIIHSWTADKRKRETKDLNQRSIRFQLGNNLGSVSLELDTSAMLISYEEYFPYGGTAIIAGTSQQEVDLKDYRYAGKECDDSTGFYYYGARYYVPWLGRWLNPDPAGIVDGLNLYAFVSNNPIRYIDPDGLAQHGWTLNFVQNLQGAGTSAQKNRAANNSLETTGAVFVGTEAMDTWRPPPRGPLADHRLVSSLGFPNPTPSMNYIVPPGSVVRHDLVPPADVLAAFQAPGVFNKPINQRVTTMAGLHGSNARKSSRRSPVSLPISGGVGKSFIHSRSSYGNRKAIAALVATAFALHDSYPAGTPMYLAGDFNQDPREVKRVIRSLPAPRRRQLRVAKSPYTTHLTRASGRESKIDFVITNIAKNHMKVTSTAPSRRNTNPDHGRLVISVKNNPSLYH